MKKLVVMFVALAMLLVSTAFAEPEVPDGIPAVVHSNTLSLRTEPKVSASRVESLKNGDFLIIPLDNGYPLRICDNSNNQFVYVYHAGEYGWVLEKLLTKNPRYLVSKDRSGTVYASQTMTVEITDHLDAEERILILEELSTGYIVNFRKTAGFVPYGDNYYIYDRVAEDAYNYDCERWGIIEKDTTAYNWPSEDSSSVCKYRKDSWITVNGEWNGYYRLSVNGHTAYVEKKVVKLQ